MTYLLAQAPRKSLGSLGLEQLVTLIQGTDVRLSLPLQTVEKLKDVSVPVQRPRRLLFCLAYRPPSQAFFEFDTDRDGALSVAELKNLTSVLGLVRDFRTLHPWQRSQAARAPEMDQQGHHDCAGIHHQAPNR